MRGAARAALDRRSHGTPRRGRLRGAVTLLAAVLGIAAPVAPAIAAASPARGAAAAAAAPVMIAPATSSTATAGPATSSVATAAGTTAAQATAAGTTAAGRSGAPAGRVVVIGVPGLRWADLSASGTPALWALAGRGAAASMSVRALPRPDRPSTCPAAGWLTISAGQRAGTPDQECARPAAPVPGAGGSASVPGWADLASFNAATSYQAMIGLLGQAVHDAGGVTAAAGPGAAPAAADRSGRIDRYAGTVEGLGDLQRYALVAAEVDDLARAWTAAPGFPAADLAPAARARAAADADRRAGEILARVPPDTTVLLAGPSDTATTAHLHVALAAGPAPGGDSYRRGHLTATSTRQDALVTITDLTATALGALGLRAPAGVVGRPWINGGPAPAATAAMIGELADADLASRVLMRVRAPFFAVFVALQIIFYGLAAVAVRRRRGGPRVLTATRVVAVAAGSVAVSTFLAQLVPWWSLPWPMAALILTIGAITGLITTLAFAGPWRRAVLGPPGVVAAVTSLALLADVMNGSRLQVNAVTGYEPVTGGRFYGFSNIAFAVFATGTLLFLAAVAQATADHRRRRPVLVGCLAYGLLAIFADGYPGWGADFGGVPAFVLGFAVFALMLTGRRVTPVRLAAIAVAGAALITAIAVADWLRPADRRTHLGAFVQQVIDGAAASVVGRKLGAMLGTLGNWQLTLLSIVALAFLYLVLARPSRWGASALSQAYLRAPALRAGLFGVLTAAVAGFLVNDSGIAIPAMALTVAVPLTLAASIQALPRPAAPTRPGRSSAPAGSTAPPEPGPR
ncbi:hypothetical protein Sru01_26430 [Sphaerisporangium rufum]|uniref:Uncharacterized protein n=1 Tax=Sphaerisporangium rufum TaxID=1381558 RepID=A0A919R0S5_9ACTN|nr:hypothetical protein Sru01_26430 [Sphaerisporangium rufum]